MHTLRGEMDEKDLRKEIEERVMPCGTATLIKFFASDGELVRQDVAMRLVTGLPLGGVAGNLFGEEA